MARPDMFRGGPFPFLLALLGECPGRGLFCGGNSVFPPGWGTATSPAGELAWPEKLAAGNWPDSAGPDDGSRAASQICRRFAGSDAGLRDARGDGV